MYIAAYRNTVSIHCYTVMCSFDGAKKGHVPSRIQTSHTNQMLKLVFQFHLHFS